MRGRSSARRERFTGSSREEIERLSTMPGSLGCGSFGLLVAEISVDAAVVFQIQDVEVSGRGANHGA